MQAATHFSAALRSLTPLRLSAEADDPASAMEAAAALRVMCGELLQCEAAQRQLREWDPAALARLEAQLVRLVEVRAAERASDACGAGQARWFGLSRLRSVPTTQRGGTVERAGCQ